MMAIVLCGDDCVGIVGNAGGRAGKKTPAMAPHKVSRGRGELSITTARLHDSLAFSICCKLTANYPIMTGASEIPTGEYRQYLPDLKIPRFQTMRKQDAHEYAHDFKTLGVPPWLHALYLHWLELLQEPFKGVTNDGMHVP